jgi:hypothetical protein
MRELAMWTIYDNPTDFPGLYVARKWLVRNGKEEWTSTVITDANLQRLRDSLPAGLFCMNRAPGDDPVIVETWL